MLSCREYGVFTNANAIDATNSDNTAKVPTMTSRTIILERARSSAT